MPSRTQGHRGEWPRATGKLNGDTKIADAGKKVYEGRLVKRDSICPRDPSSGLDGPRYGLRRRSRGKLLRSEAISPRRAVRGGKTQVGRVGESGGRASRFQLVLPSA